MYPIPVDPNEKERKELLELQEKVAQLLAEKESMFTHERPMLLKKYMQNVGFLEQRSHECEYNAKRTQRKMRLIELLIEEGIPLDKHFIENQLDKMQETSPLIKEDTTFKASQNPYFEGMHHSRNRGTGDNTEKQEETISTVAETQIEELSEAEIQDLKSVYYKLVKKLHPDLVEELTQRMKELWIEVQQAYQNRDIATLRHILENLELFKEGSRKIEDKELLLAMIKKVRSQFFKLQLEIATLRNEFPFSEKYNLRDPEWLWEKTRMYTVLINRYEKDLQSYEKKIEELIKDPRAIIANWD